MPFKVIVAGSRSFENYPLLQSELTRFLDGQRTVEIVSGHARGADRLAERFAYENRLALKIFSADWARWGRGAGPRRNGQMAAYADALLAFWDGNSRGTADMIAQMEAAGKVVHIVNFR